MAEGEARSLRPASNTHANIAAFMEQRTGTTVNLSGSAMDPLQHIPILEVLEASYSQSDFVLTYGEILHDYLKQPAPATTAKSANKHHNFRTPYGPKTGVLRESGPMQRKTTIPGKKSESLDVEQHPWSLIGIVPQGRPDRGLSRAIESQPSCSYHLAVYSLGSHHAASR
jgi:hypothetical protein